ncbi:MAG: division plane positioning ATPase MipZ [Kiloniellales bacterium]
MTLSASAPRRSFSRPHVVVVGNEKGGSGKTTTAMHLTVALLDRGFDVGCIDLDSRQATLTRYLENRRDYMEAQRLALPMPMFQRVFRSQAASQAEREAEEIQRFGVARAGLGPVDFLIIDTPGSDSFLSRVGHSHADSLITPLNDSFLDLDLLARVDLQGQKILSPSIYSQMVWEQRQKRAAAGRPPIDWIVMRNRLSHIDAKSKRDMADVLERLAQRIGFRVVAGFGERVIYRELFPKGLTLFDLRRIDGDVAMTMSHIAARQEVRALLSAVALPEGFDDEGRDDGEEDAAGEALRPREAGTLSA